MTEKIKGLKIIEDRQEILELLDKILIILGEMVDYYD